MGAKEDKKNLATQRVEGPDGPVFNQAPRYKSKPRSDELKKNIELRLNRAIGQLNGIKSMVEDDRYCGDILIQLSAAQSALDKVQQIILKNHLETCVVDRIQANDLEVVNEFAQLLKLSKVTAK